ncbi:5-(carboxyamino)imidazole ribonucleotide mutase [bacterium]|nr:5-(carboxyamino)imidazole ribonucleotide mutase [bacterium]PIV80706.1 MAG: 5-(carboxyamino)imidazole ribonucleotide mutase [bacterium CG17_big_fil_post_rev_8_21_14_2_50_64_8]PJA74658.1 MAG: 5-(carboxyamino)imidazole ribonucleotide mutase [bacterium CG_4_9_14_3_um_filter_65_15]
MKAKKNPRVLVLLGSSSDLPVLEKALPLLDRFGLTHQVEIASAHRQPRKLHRLVQAADKGGTEVFIAVAGMAAALPGVVASLTTKPVIGVPVAAGALAGMDAMVSMVQMPPGVPVATVAIGSAGARNAAVLAARIIALHDSTVAEAVADHQREMARGGR